METRTSNPPHELQLTMIVPGLGLTMAPGRQGPSRDRRILWQRDLGADLDRLRDIHRVDLLVSLLEPHERRAFGVPDLLPEAERGMRVLALPIVDGGIPSSREAVNVVVREIVDCVRTGGITAIHCAAGLGRSGTIGGCALVALGHDLNEVFELLRRRSNRCPENEAQKNFIRRQTEG